MLYRVFRWSPGASADAAGGVLFVPRDRQGAGRHDSPGRYGAFYAARTPIAAVAETIQAFRGRELAEDDLTRADGTTLALGELEGGRLRSAGVDRIDGLNDPEPAGLDEGVRAQLGRRRRHGF